MKWDVAPLVLLLAWASACAGGPTSTSATETATETATTTASTGAGTDGISSTSAGSTAATADATTGSTTESTSASSGGRTTGDGVCRSDLGLGPEHKFQCDIWDQDDCCPGEKCNAWANDGGAWNATRCVPVDPNPDAVGEPCTVVGDAVSGIDSCEQGAMCWNVISKTNMGTCVALCEGNADQCARDPYDCCQPFSTCVLSGGGSLNLCLPVCDPLLQNCEANGDACYPAAGAFHCSPDVSGEMGAVGDPCESLNTCDPGTYCGDPGDFPGCDPKAAGCCIPFCDLEAPACPPATECQPWFDPLDTPAGFETLGACRLA